MDENKKNWEHRTELVQSLIGMVKNQSGFILLAGKNGTGKTFSARTVYNAAIHPLKSPAYNHDIAFFSNQADLSLKLENERSKYGGTWNYLEYIRKTKFFIFDDIGTRVPSESFMDFLYAVIDYRYDNQLATIITTNKNSTDLRLMLGDAFVSRAASGKVFRFEGEDRRRKDF